MAGSCEYGWLNAQRADGRCARDTMMMVYLHTRQKFCTKVVPLMSPKSNRISEEGFHICPGASCQGQIQPVILGGGVISVIFGSQVS